MSCPPTLTCYKGDKVKAVVTWINQTANYLTCTVYVAIGYVSGDRFYIIADGYNSGTAPPNQSIPTEVVTSPIPAGYTGNFYLVAYLGVDFDPSTRRFQNLYDMLPCENAISVAS
jgi:hypothetical protein